MVECSVKGKDSKFLRAIDFYLVQQDAVHRCFTYMLCFGCPYVQYTSF